MTTRKRQPARPASAPLNRAAMRARRWAALGRELDRRDPRRRSALLLLAEWVIREHRRKSDFDAARVRHVKYEIRQRFARR